MTTTLTHWLQGVRFYIAVLTLVTTATIIGWSYEAYSGTVLYPTRVEEIFAWLATGLLILAISIGPAYKLMPRLPGRKIVHDARRLIGISAGWFASLHVAIAYAGLFKNPNPFALPAVYQRAFLLGGIALLILLAMTFTSFDKAFTKMGIWWFRLHRGIYLAVILILLHAFMIGVHATGTIALLLITVIAGGLLSVYAYTGLLKQAPSRWQLITITSMAVALAVVISYGYSKHLLPAPGASNG